MEAATGPPTRMLADTRLRTLKPQANAYRLAETYCLCICRWVLAGQR